MSCVFVKGSVYRCQWKLTKIKSPATFTDVITKNKYKLSKSRVQAIKWFAQMGISVCLNSKGKAVKKCAYNPQNSVNRGAMAEFLWKLWAKPDANSKGYPVSLKKYYLKDIKLNALKKSGLTTARYNTVQYLASKSIFGKVAAKYNPQKNVTRAVMAEWMYRLVGEPKFKPSKADIKLVKTDYKKGTTTYQQKAILWLAHNKITIPGADRKYNPQNPVNRRSMAEFLQKLYKNIISA